jgi:hypothetical protein
MPQFDFFSFFNQVFWISISVVFFYLLCLKFPLKNISESFKMRKKLLLLKSKLSKSFDKNAIYKKLILIILNSK